MDPRTRNFVITVVAIVAVILLVIVGIALFKSAVNGAVDARVDAADTTKRSDASVGSDPTTDSSNMVGGKVLSACEAIPDLQIEKLRENGSIVANAYMGLDLNSNEVEKGVRYVIDLPANAYAQYYVAGTDETCEAVGPTRVEATAYTTWCNNAGWLNQQGFPTGAHRQLDANNMPEPYRDAGWKSTSDCH